MSKKFLFTILISSLISFAASVSQAGVISDSGNAVMRMGAEVSFEAPPSTVSIFHVPIERVSVNLRTLVAVGTITLSGASTNLKPMIYSETKDIAGSAVYLEYYTDEDTAPVKVQASYKKVAPGTYVFETVPLLMSKKDIFTHYRIAAESDDGVIGYYPETGYVNTEHDGHTRDGNIGVAGGKLVLQSGDQRRGDTSVSFVGGALLADVNFRIRELYSDVDPLPASESAKPLITYHFTPENLSLQNNLKPIISIYYGDLPQPDFNNIEVKWFNIDNRKWENVSFTNNIDLRTATVNLAATGTNLGYYAIFTKSSSADEGFGPDRHVLKPSDLKVIFRGLKSGDTIRIYNTRGKVVKRIDFAPFEWDKKDDNGNFAETGSYIYQIKVDGKTTSGTIVIVK